MSGGVRDLDKTRDGAVLLDGTVDRLVSLCLFLVGELQMQKEHRDEVIETIKKHAGRQRCTR